LGFGDFCAGKPQPDFELVRPSIPTLANNLVFSRDDEILSNACWALSYLSDGANEKKIQAVIDAGICPRLFVLVLNRSPAVQTPALRTVGNIANGNDLQTQCIINKNALPCLLALLSLKTKGIPKEACWVISNITGTYEYRPIGADGSSTNFCTLCLFIQPATRSRSNASLIVAEFEIRKEAAWAISNATSGGNKDQIMFLVDQGCIRPLCDLLTVNDPKIVTIALEGIENILKVGATDSINHGGENQMARFVTEAEGLNKVEELQKHMDNDIYEKCLNIIETYFGIEAAIVSP
jgi:importin subunit alpha-6/7